MTKKKKILSPKQQCRREFVLQRCQELFDQGVTVPWPKSRSEFELQVFLYRRLRKMGYSVRGNVLDVFGRFCDLVVFSRKRKPLIVIEVKRRVDPEIMSYRDLLLVKKQVEAYRRTEVPVCLVIGWARAKELLAEIQKGKLPKADWHCDEYDEYINRRTY